MAQIPLTVIGAAAPILGDWHGHTALNSKFLACGFPGEPPAGNKIEKVRVWLTRGNSQVPDPLRSFGMLIAEMMDDDWKPPTRYAWDGSPPVETPDPREPLRHALAEAGLSYSRGGFIHGANLTGPAKSLREQLQQNGFKTVEREIDRALKSVESDPPQAVTAACAVLEALCKNYLNHEEQETPNKQLLGKLLPQVMKHLGLAPEDYKGDIQ